MRLTRRDFMQAAIAAPLGVSFLHFEALAAPARRQVRITAIKAMQTKAGTIIRIETDAGIVGYGPSASSGPSLATGPYVRDVIREFSSDSGSTAGLTLIGKDPLDIEVHHFDMLLRTPSAAGTGRC